MTPTHKPKVKMEKGFIKLFNGGVLFNGDFDDAQFCIYRRKNKDKTRVPCTITYQIPKK